MKKFFSSLFKGIATGVKAVLDGFGHVFVFVVIILTWLPVRILFPTKIIGKKNLKADGGRVVVSNHFSNLDAIILVYCLRPINRMKFLAKKELTKFAPFGWLLKIIGAVYIDRKSTDIKAMKQTSALLKKGKMVTIFAEGTRNKTDGEDLQELKGGAVFFASSTSSYIIPMRILHRPRLFRRNCIIIGEPYKPERGGKEQKEKEVNLLTEKMEDLKNKCQPKGE